MIEVSGERGSCCAGRISAGRNGGIKAGKRAGGSDEDLWLYYREERVEMRFFGRSLERAVWSITNECGRKAKVLVCGVTTEVGEKGGGREEAAGEVESGDAG